MVSEGKRDGDLAKSREIHGESIVWCTAYIKTTKDMMLMFGSNKTIDQLAIVSRVHWYSHVLRTEDGHVMKRE